MAAFNIFSAFLMTTAIVSAGRIPPIPEPASIHEAEAAAKRVALTTARDKGLIAVEGWAPLQEPSPIDVASYDLSLFLDFDREVVSGAVEIDLAIVEDGIDSVDFDAWAGLRILGVTVLEDSRRPFASPVEAGFSHVGDVLSIPFPGGLEAGRRLRILVSYGGRASSRGYGINWDHHDGGRIAWTMAEPFGARVWWPCNDRPDDKATVRLSVTAPAQYTVASNGVPYDTPFNHDDGTTTSIWESVYPVATYLVVMNVADFVRSESIYESTTGTTMPVVLYALPEVADQAELDLADTPEMIRTMAGYFGEYPFIEEKYGNCTVDFGGGMEHQTLTSIAAGAVGGSWMPWLNVHELGHQWWGDWVTCADWRDLWLNEGFATLTEWLWAEHLGEATLRSYLEQSDRNGLFLGPVYDNPVPFSGTVYDKGAWVLRMLRRLLGDEVFFNGVAAYRQAFPGGAATTEDLKTAFEGVSGLDLDRFFDQWVYGKNRPSFHYSWQPVAGPALSLTMKQVQRNAGLFEMPLDLRVTTTAGTEDHQIDIAAVTRQTFDIPLDAPATAITFDPNQWSLFLAKTDDRPDLDLGPLSPGPFDAGFASAVQSNTLTIPLSNIGGAPLEILAWGFSYSSVPDFSIVSPGPLPLTLDPGESIDIEIRFQAADMGIRSNWLYILSNDPDADGLTLARVEGHGTVLPGTWLELPSRLNFPETPTLSAEERSLTLSNYGDTDLALSARIEGNSFSLLQGPPTLLAAGDQATLLVRFLPASTGSFEGTLTIETDDPSKPRFEVSLRGEGIPAPHIEISPTTLDLGVGAAPASGIVTITNGGNEDLNLLEISIEGPFQTVAAPSFPMTLAPGERLDLEVGTIPRERAGTYRGILRILSDDPVLPWATVPLWTLETTDPVTNDDGLPQVEASIDSAVSARVGRPSPGRPESR